VPVYCVALSGTDSKHLSLKIGMKTVIFYLLMGIHKNPFTALAVTDTGFKYRFLKTSLIKKKSA
jgi:hypothetical protein